MCSAPKQPKIPTTPPPPAPAQPAASIGQSAPLSPEKQTDLQLAKRSGVDSLRIPLKRSARSGSAGPSLNLPRK